MNQDTKLKFAVTDPADLSKFDYSDDYECVPGEWTTISVEVRQEEADPSTLRFTMKMGDTQLHSGTYAATEELKSYDLQVFVGNPWVNSATGMLVRNFYYQTFEEIPV
ncbi:Oidioi.mRNA.OKI2018_I69.chr1.g1697.t1.cds [Oikopleura dioica]|uniref:Oidioi.mRNA.OKI2018_I69.chr1.g1697.t1.cds n=1 Tax=Oikopleura dioica TaxID=34765 RepID=A0ABN7SNQ4_OIKDI|nr:Oidioi.mRNA.OKI2018_I69.chr1.g1697.t1.cds [Oikopleura dioica]